MCVCVCVCVCVCGEGVGCRNVSGTSAPAGTQLAIDGRTLRAVLVQPGRLAALHSPTALASSSQTRGEADVLLKILSPVERPIFLPELVKKFGTSFHSSVCGSFGERTRVSFKGKVITYLSLTVTGKIPCTEVSASE